MLTSSGALVQMIMNFCQLLYLLVMLTSSKALVQIRFRLPPGSWGCRTAGMPKGQDFPQKQSESTGDSPLRLRMRVSGSDTAYPAAASLSYMYGYDYGLWVMGDLKSRWVWQPTGRHYML